MRARVSLRTRMIAASRSPWRPLLPSPARAAAASACAQPMPATWPRPRGAGLHDRCGAARHGTGCPRWDRRVRWPGAPWRWTRGRHEWWPGRRRRRGGLPGRRRRRPRWPGSPDIRTWRPSAATRTTPRRTPCGCWARARRGRRRSAVARLRRGAAAAGGACAARGLLLDGLGYGVLGDRDHAAAGWLTWLAQGLQEIRVEPVPGRP